MATPTISQLASTPQSRIVELFPLDFRALVAPSSANVANRTVDLTFSTGAGVKRYDWNQGTYYIEKLGMTPDNVRLDRLNNGAPLLDTHDGYSVADMLGAVVRGSAKIANGQGVATVQFSSRDDVAGVWQDVCDGLISNVSVGYMVYAYTEVAGKDGGIPTRTAIDWEPYEISMVPMPADTGAQTRAADPRPKYPCTISVRSESPADPQPQERTMPAEQTASETVAERNPLDPGAPTVVRVAAAATEPTDAEIGTRVERDRVQGIMAACRASRMPQEFQDGLIRDGASLIDAQTRVFEEMRKRGGEDLGPRSGAARDVRVEDPMVHVRAGIENALTHRLAGDFRKKDGTPHFPLSDVGRNYRGMTLMDVARAYLQGRGLRVTNLGKYELAGVALGLTDVRDGGMHTTSDFASLLENVASKTLRAAYEEQPQTFLPLVRVVSLVDFKPVSRVQLGDAPALVEIGENGEYKSGTISDGKVAYQLASYGRKFAISRKALINDDTDAFARVPMMFGRKARVLESNLVWGQITSNPTMSDGNALFSAPHGNIAADGDHISVESLGRGRTALRQQKSIDGDYLNLNAQYLIVPTSLETIADQFVTVITPQAGANVNPFQNRLTVIAEPRLDAISVLAWYLSSPVANVDIIELGYLEGEEGPRIESRIGFDVDGLEVKCGIDVVAKVIDFRGLYQDPGDLDS